MSVEERRAGAGDDCRFWAAGRREWERVIDLLRERIRVCVGMDLPGFGESRDVPGYTVEEMAESLMETIATP